MPDSLKAYEESLNRSYTPCLPANKPLIAPIASAILSASNSASVGPEGSSLPLPLPLPLSSPAPGPGPVVASCICQSPPPSEARGSSPGSPIGPPPYSG